MSDLMKMTNESQSVFDLLGGWVLILYWLRTTPSLVTVKFGLGHNGGRTVGLDGKSSESVQCAMLKACECDACTDMGQL